jgi:signal transduction histidine kinase/CheY-like chemotaxis protein
MEINLLAIFINQSLQAICLIVLVILISIYIFQTNKKQNRILNLEKEVDSQNKEIDNQKEKFLDSVKKNANLKNIIENQTEQINQLKRDFDNIQGKLDEKVLKRTSELHTLLEKTVESNRLKEAFLEKISREIRTPLNSILGFVNLLNDSNLGRIDREYYLKFIRESGNNLLTLIDNIVDFSRLETGEILVEYRKCNLIVLVADLVDKYRSRLVRDKSKVTIFYNKPETSEESLADCRRILNILDQLINNAMKFTSSGKIEVNYTINQSHHVFTVSDTGIGIDEIYLDIIFERFYQIESEVKEYFQGAGLGLTIVKGLTDLLGGKIEVKSEPNKGSDFILSIPFKELKAKDAKRKKTELSLNWKDKTILIAEDEDSNYHFLEAILKKTKANILWAADGLKFLEIIDQNKDIDLVLLDIKMPGINGFNAIKVIRQQNISIPVIAQTAFNQPEDKQKCLESGCDDYLAKPIDRDLLLSKISNFFNHQ